MNKTPRHLALAVASALALTACSDNDNDNDDAAPATQSQISVSGHLGLVFNATANVYQADGVTLLGSADTGASGAINVPVGSYVGPVVIEVAGDADATYFDEAAGTVLPFPAGQALHALAPSVLGQVPATFLTEVAYRNAVAAGALGANLTATQVSAFNDLVRLALAPGLNSLLTRPVNFDSATAPGSLDNTDEGRYALYLAAIARLGAGQSAPALAAQGALLADLADGVIDGMANDTSVGAPYNDFYAQMAQNLVDLASAFGTAALQSVAATQAPAAPGNGGTDTGGTDTGGTDTGGTDTGGTDTGGTDTGGTDTGGTDTGGTDTGGTDTGGTDTGGTDTGGTDTGGTDTGGGAVGETNASACFDEVFGAIGTHVDQSFRSTSSGGTITTDSSLDVSSGTYNGQTVMVARSMETFSGTVSGTSQSVSFFLQDPATLTETTFATEATTQGFTVSVTLNPPKVEQFDLEPGESYTQMYSISTESAVAPFPIPDVAETETVTYLGRESLTVTAGTFNACKFQRQSTSSGSTSTSTVWLYASGIVLRQISGDTTTELLSASVNGSPIQ